MIRRGKESGDTRTRRFANVLIGLVILGCGSAWHVRLAESSLAWDAESAPVGHVNAVVSGRRLARETIAGQTNAVSLSENAGETYSIPLVSAGRYASWWMNRGHDIEDYKIGLWCLAGSIPILIWTAARLAGRSWIQAGLAVCIGVWVWWLRPNAAYWSAGRVEWTLLGPLAGLYLAGLSRFHRHCDMWSWTALAGSSYLGWALLAQEWAAFFLPATVCWLVISHRHTWIWHGGLILAVIAGAAPSVTVWYDFVSLSAFSGWWPANWQPLPTPEAGFPSWTPWAIHAALALLCFLALDCRKWLVRFAIAAAAASCVYFWHPEQGEGSVMEAEKILRCSQVRLSVDSSARVLIEASRDDDRLTSLTARLLFSAQAPLLTAGPDTNGNFPWSLTDGNLGQRPIADWSDDELNRLFERWNIGWIVTQSASSTRRLAQMARVKRRSAGAENAFVFSIDRRRRFVLRGEATWSVNNDHEIVLTDAVPEQGEIVLSLRYAQGWSARPSRVAIETEVDPYDPLPAVRLRMNGPVSRIVLRLDH